MSKYYITNNYNINLKTVEKIIIKRYTINRDGIIGKNYEGICTILYTVTFSETL